MFSEKRRKFVMTEQCNSKPNYGDKENHHEYNPQHLPVNTNYRQTNTDDFYKESDNSAASSFIIGALVGSVIGAATALFLAPKTGKEMRQDFSHQAIQLKDKSIELGSAAKEKATELSTVAKDKTTEFATVAKEKTAAFTTVAKEKTGELTKTIQEQSGQLVDKVKSMTNKTSVPIDDGTASSEGEEAEDFTAQAQASTEESATTVEQEQEVK